MLPYLGSIFMLHRTAPYERGNFLYNEGLKISPQELDSVLLQLKRSKKVFIGLDDVPHILKESKPSKFKYAVFTLDDGYKDNLEYGYDIFKKHNVPFSIYVTNSFPNNTTNLWWYALENLILKNNVLQMPDRKVENGTMSQRRNNFLIIRKQILNHHFKDPITYLKQLGHLDFDLTKQQKQKCLTWNEIKQLSTDPLVTIGGHTLNHYPLSKLNQNEVEFEIKESKRELEDQLQKQVDHFAFPFGSKNEANKRDYRIAKSMNFKTISTTVHGHFGRADNPHELNRIFLYSLQNNSTSMERLMKWNLKSLLYFGKKILNSI